MSAVVDALTRGGFFDVGSGLPGRYVSQFSAEEWRERIAADLDRRSARRSPGPADFRPWAGERPAPGLSGLPYLPATVPDANLRCEIRPGGVKIRAELPELRLKAGARATVKRGRITELSDRSRARLADLARDLGETETPDLFATLSYPGEFRSVAGNGRQVKRHMKALRSRLGRYLEQVGVPSWAALWFLEFQQRGAPHVHLILWGGFRFSFDLRQFRRWLSLAWAEIVGHPDRVQRARHERAGSGVERMRVGHFGYAVKYASKMEQKRVPPDFGDVGRFWGLWNADRPCPAVLSLACPPSALLGLVERLATVAGGYSDRFAARMRGRLQRFERTGDAFSVNVWGADAVRALLAGLDEYFP